MEPQGGYGFSTSLSVRLILDVVTDKLVGFEENRGLHTTSQVVFDQLV